MPRPIKRRKVCMLPDQNRFGPLGPSDIAGDAIIMTIDEYETIRLIDLEGFTQEEAAQQMAVARTTVQGIYAEARHKLAQTLVNSCALILEGGEYELCDELVQNCGPGCRRHARGAGHRPGQGQGQGAGRGNHPGRGQGRGKLSGEGQGSGHGRE